MAPAAKKNNPKPGARDRPSRSRNTTPVSGTLDTASTTTSAVSPPAGETDYLHTSLATLLVPPNVSIEALIEQHSANTSTPPSAIKLNALHDGILEQVLTNLEKRGDICNRGVRELAVKRKERHEAQRAREEEERIDEERRKRELKKVIGKKREREETEDETRPPTVGARGMARQDGVDVHKGTPPPSSASAQVAESAAAREEGTSPAGSEVGHQPPPAPAIPQYQTFGEDPSKFDDPTIYDIRPLTPDMTDEEKKEILCVATYPHSDLHDLTCGTPPDMDFSNAKPANQINFSTFQAYIEPYTRPLTEEDVAFLKERGDRFELYVLPPRGSLPYKEVWAKEDGTSTHDSSNSSRPPVNEPRGSIESMDDQTALTEEVSTGPVLARLLELFQHDTSVNASNANNSSTDANGDISMTNGETTAGDAEESGPTNSSGDDTANKPAFQELCSTPSYSSSFNAPREYSSLEARALQELRYMGILTPDESPDYDGAYDDEVAARLRYLQSELRRVSLENGARKARVLELTEERMAMQEYNTIADDLDTQINTAYLKRNRTMSKPKKGAQGKARPGVAQGLARNVVGEGVRMLMERRKEWRELIGPVVDFGQKGIPKETVFDKQTMERLAKAEGEVGDGEGE